MKRKRQREAQERDAQFAQMTEDQVAEWRQKKWDDGIFYTIRMNLISRTKTRRSITKWCIAWSKDCNRCKLSRKDV